MIDLTVVADNADLIQAHQLKVDYYETEHVRDWARRVSGVANVSFSSLTFNWRGALAPPSRVLLCNDLSLSKSFIHLLAVIAVEKGFQIWLDFGKSTYTINDHGTLNGLYEHFDNIMEQLFEETL